MCKECVRLPKEYLIRDREEFFQLMVPIQKLIENGCLKVVNQNYDVEDMLDGKMEDPFKNDNLYLVLRCEECGSYYTCAYQKYKGAGFWERNGSPF